jgi:hypothetical protein
MHAPAARFPLPVQGTAAARLPLRNAWESGEYNVIIMSYETCRADIAWLEPTRWLYVILDEGHIIKNAKTKVPHFYSDRCMCTHLRLPMLIENKRTFALL